MIDMSQKNIKKLFEHQISELTKRTNEEQGQLFDYQMSGGWVQ